MRDHDQFWDRVYYTATFRTPIVENVAYGKISFCKDKRRKWRARRNKRVNRVIDQLMKEYGICSKD